MDGKIKISQKLWMKNMTGISLQKFRKRMQMVHGRQLKKIQKLIRQKS